MNCCLLEVLRRPPSWFSVAKLFGARGHGRRFTLDRPESMRRLSQLDEERSVNRPNECCHDEAKSPLSRYRPSLVLRSFLSARITWTMYTVFCS